MKRFCKFLFYSIYVILVNNFFYFQVTTRFRWCFNINDIIFKNLNMKYVSKGNHNQF
ncbi:hypothetical protein HANVADRAFT_95241 [Hanseniaspora valbyensis NRRL Y-1626]|uniref:Uncharacterized protein n=1 Tax=Hanseniaspora valbyensis NRRL Y-1626 TaxID=766949 RepID=A0A1B7TB08_9ASCO|nr:hypothetical protein HANVADRAFT_95241 [Hanseniaspora valbyensis NRRL Y-1626]